MRPLKSVEPETIDEVRWVVLLPGYLNSNVLPVAGDGVNGLGYAGPAGELAEVTGNLKAIGVPSFSQELLGSLRIVGRGVENYFLPGAEGASVPDRPDGEGHSEVGPLGDRPPVDGQAQRLPYPAVQSGVFFEPLRVGEVVDLNITFVHPALRILRLPQPVG